VTGGRGKVEVTKIETGKKSIEVNNFYNKNKILRVNLW
jgi:hypothetical protein